MEKKTFIIFNIFLVISDSEKNVFCVLQGEEVLTLFFFPLSCSAWFHHVNQTHFFLPAYKITLTIDKGRTPTVGMLLFVSVRVNQWQ